MQQKIIPTYFFGLEEKNAEDLFPFPDPDSLFLSDSEFCGHPGADCPLSGHFLPAWRPTPPSKDRNTLIAPCPWTDTSGEDNTTQWSH